MNKPLILIVLSFVAPSLSSNAQVISKKLPLIGKIFRSFNSNYSNSGRPDTGTYKIWDYNNTGTFGSVGRVFEINELVP